MKYRPKDIKGYIRGEEVFETKVQPTLFSPRIFVKRIETGAVNLYRYDYRYYEWIFFIPVPIDCTVYYVQKTGENIKKVYDDNEILLAFKKKFAEYFKDCPEVSENILNKVEGYRYDDIRNIVQVYNDYMESKQ